MKIDRNMSLGELAERMGDYATIEEAGLLRDILLELPHTDTKHVPTHEWYLLLACVVQQHDPA